MPGEGWRSLHPSPPLGEIRVTASPSKQNPATAVLIYKTAAFVLKTRTMAADVVERGEQPLRPWGEG